ncbi:CD276 antigen homolog [Antennarius striatus]|uniref:CD276 antigen homolog n=1 Tax=Antennarius striatus TaxID=241820 RepID=UPI0035B2ABF1
MESAERTRLSWFVCLLAAVGGTDGRGGVVVKVTEGQDAFLPCTISPLEDLSWKVFDWKKDETEEVFLYDQGFHYSDNYPGQDPRFKGRVSHFPNELVNGSASIVIRSVTPVDGGIYTCVFPRLRPPQTYHIQLVVGVPLMDRSCQRAGACPQPSIRALSSEGEGVGLQCQVQNASPRPRVEWRDSAGNVLPAKEIPPSEGLEHITLEVTVTTTDLFSCVVTQEEINHQVTATTFVFIKAPTGGNVFLIAGVFISGILMLLIVVGLLTWKRVAVKCSGGWWPYCCLSEKRYNLRTLKINQHHPEMANMNPGMLKSYPSV